MSPSNPGRRRLAYNPAFDGLRALAVSAVLLFHGGPAAWPGGFLGVSTFFTLSGFLIGSLLLLEHQEHGGVALRLFWVRRLRRLMPAALLTLAAIALAGAVVAHGRSLAAVRDDGLAALLYVANWHFIRTGQSYADLFLAPSPVQHFWSLAIEEQFYLVFPILTVAALRLGGGSRRVVLGVYAGLAVASVLWNVRLHALSADPARVYYGTDTRAFELLLGAVLAVALAGRTLRPSRWIDAAGVVALLLSLVAWRTIDDRAGWLYPWGLLAYAVATVAVIAAAGREGLVHRLLALPPLPALGRISYGVYLFHWPVDLWLDADRTGLGPLALFALRTTVTILFAVCSYRLVELPVRAGVWPVGRRSWQAAGLAAAAVASALLLLPRRGNDAAIVLDESGIAAVAVGGANAARPRILMVGDSVAASLASGFGTWAARQDVEFASVARTNCGVVSHLGDALCADLRDVWRAAITNFDPDVVVVLLSYWDLDDRKTRSPRGYVSPGDPERDQALLAGFAQFAATMTGRGATLVWLTLPCVGYDLLGEMTKDLVMLDPARIAYMNSKLLPQLLEAQSNRPRADRPLVVDLFGIVCPQGEFRSVLGPASGARPDGVHFTKQSASWVADQVGGTLEGIARRTRERRARQRSG